MRKDGSDVGFVIAFVYLLILMFVLGKAISFMVQG